MPIEIATLISWLITVSLGGFMLRTWLVRDGLRRARARDGGLPPKFIFSHATLAVVGLLVWCVYVATSVRALAWAAVIMVMATVSLGLCTVTLWTPYPARKPGERRPATIYDAPVPAVPDTIASIVGAADAPGPDAPGSPDGSDVPDAPDEPAAGAPAFQVTDEMIARVLAEPVAGPGRRPVNPNPAVIIPVAHGAAALTTFLLAMLSAIGA